MRTPMRRFGFTLIEMVCAIVLLAVLGLVVTILLRDVLGLERSQSASFDRMLEINALADQFRADVGQAERTLHEWQDYKAGPKTLILKMRTGDYLIYQWEEGKLLRRLQEEDKATEREMPIGGLRVEPEIVHPGAASRLVWLRLHSLTGGGERISGRALDIGAALGGESR